MPNIITHTIFSEEVLKTIKNKSYKQQIKKYKQLYRIGTNGPDFLFFHDVFPLNKKQDMTISTIGTRFHRTKINAFYKQAIAAYHEQSDLELKAAVATYIIGHYLHWQLDSVMHPYVVYRTGFKKAFSKMHHHRLESMVDTILLKRKRNTSIRNYKTYTLCDHDAFSVECIASVYTACIKKCFELEVSKADIQKALDDWQKAQRYLYDPWGVKHALLRFIELCKKQPGLSANVVRAKEDYRYDVMNDKHQTWYHPCTGQASTQSVEQLFDYALEQAQTGIPLLIAAFDQNKVNPFLQFIDNKTYTNGIKGKCERLYQDDIYEKKGY